MIAIQLCTKVTRLGCLHTVTQLVIIEIQNNGGITGVLPIKCLWALFFKQSINRKSVTGVAFKKYLDLMVCLVCIWGDIFSKTYQLPFNIYCKKHVAYRNPSILSWCFCHGRPSHSESYTICVPPTENSERENSSFICLFNIDWITQSVETTALAQIRRKSHWLFSLYWPNPAPPPPLPPNIVGSASDLTLNTVVCLCMYCRMILIWS